MVTDPAVQACDCPCHQDPTVLHPVACCAPCVSCGVRIPTGTLAHTCSRTVLGSTATPPVAAGLASGITRYETSFAGLMALMVMGIAIYSAGPAAGLLVGAASLGAVVAIVKLRHGRR